MKKLIFAIAAFIFATSSYAGLFSDGYGVITKMEEVNLAGTSQGNTAGSDGAGNSGGTAAAVGSGGGVASFVVGYVVGYAANTAINKNRDYIPGLIVTIKTDDGQEITRMHPNHKIYVKKLSVGMRVSYRLSGKTHLFAMASDKPLPHELKEIQTKAIADTEKTIADKNAPNGKIAATTLEKARAVVTEKTPEGQPEKVMAVEKAAASEPEKVSSPVAASEK